MVRGVGVLDARGRCPLCVAREESRSAKAWNRNQARHVGRKPINLGSIATALTLSPAAADLELPIRPDVMSEEELGKYAGDVDDFVDFAKTELSRNEQRLGVVLLMIRNEKLYEILGHVTFEAYLADKGIGKSTAYRYLQQAEVYLLPDDPPATPTQVAAMGLVKSLAIAEDVKGKTPAEAAELVSDALSLSEGDLRTRLEERKGRVPDGMTECLRGIRSQLATYLARLQPPAIDDPEKTLEELSGEAIRWRAMVKRLRTSG